MFQASYHNLIVVTEVSQYNSKQQFLIHAIVFVYKAFIRKSIKGMPEKCDR